MVCIAGRIMAGSQRWNISCNNEVFCYINWNVNGFLIPTKSMVNHFNESLFLSTILLKTEIVVWIHSQIHQGAKFLHIYISVLWRYKTAPASETSFFANACTTKLQKCKIAEIERMHERMHLLQKYIYWKIGATMNVSKTIILFIVV